MEQKRTYIWSGSKSWGTLCVLYKN